MESATFDPIFDVDLDRNPSRAAIAPKEKPQFDVDGRWARMSTGERSAAIQELVDKHATATAIAFALGASTSAIRAHASRNDIVISGQVSRAAAPSPVPVDEQVSPEAWRPLPGSSPKPLVDATGCMWPVTDGGADLFCDEPIHAGRYCRHHHRRSRGTIEPFPHFTRAVGALEDEETPTDEVLAWALGLRESGNAE